jgi:hypothetical protein
MPIMFSVPPDLGVPVPGLSAWKPATWPGCAGGVIVLPLLLLLDELLHAAASMVTATALATAPTARKRKCLTTLLLL